MRTELQTRMRGAMYLRWRPASVSNDPPLDLAQLRAGQLVRARLTIVINEPRRTIEIADALPANAVLISAGDSADFADTDFADGRITLADVALEPGIYEYFYLLRMVAGGRYSVPAPTARAADGASCRNELHRSCHQLRLDQTLSIRRLR